jgi:hypothetical protein
MTRYPVDEEELEGLEGMLYRQYRGTVAQSAARSPLLNRLGTLFQKDSLMGFPYSITFLQ